MNQLKINTTEPGGFLPYIGIPSSAHFTLLFVFFLCLFVDLGGGLLLRSISLALLALTVSLTMVSKPKTFAFYVLNPSILILFVVSPLLSSLIGLFHQAELHLMIQNILVLLSFPFLLVFFSNFDTNTVLRSFVSAATTLGMFTLIFWLMLYLENPLALSFATYLSEKEVGFFGIRGLSGISFPVVYFKATLFFVPAVVFSIFQHRMFSALILIAALMAATSKTGMAIATLFILISVARKRPYLLASLLILACAFILVSPLFNGFRQAVVALFTDENTLNTRLEHWNSLSELFAQNPSYLLFGQGAGTSFYTGGAEDFVNNIELDHLNSIRKFGLLWFTCFLVFMSAVVYGNYKYGGARLAAALLATFAICGTNPVLLTLLFFSILGFSYIDLVREKLASGGTSTVRPEADKRF